MVELLEVLVGSLLAEKINKRIGESKTLLISIALFGIGGFVPFITSNPFVVAAAFGVTSFGSVLWNVQAVSIRQALIPDKLMGRVNSVYRLLALGLTPSRCLIWWFCSKNNGKFFFQRICNKISFSNLWNIHVYSFFDCTETFISKINR
jgi:MFS family permease